MAEPLVVHLFAEDRAHEEFLKALLMRLAAQEGRQMMLHVLAARGGHGRVLRELEIYQRSIIRAVPWLRLPDLVIVAADANCQPFAKARQNVRSALDHALRERTVVACPDPHIESWYLADPESFARVVGARPRLGRKKCERDRYKSILASTIREAGHPPTLGGIEFAKELVEAMDLFRAGKAETSLKHFLDEVLGHLRQR
ncbi:MAG: DUF4276 family protein [Verrucomicrobiales bacterium]|nr:DUF4276 family protein [Verrucomicrobiales bacterium]